MRTKQAFFDFCLDLGFYITELRNYGKPTTLYTVKVLLLLGTG